MEQIGKTAKWSPSYMGGSPFDKQLDVHDYVIKDADGIQIARVNADYLLAHKKGTTFKDIEANAKLISAAPELLKALKGLISYFEFPFKEYVDAVQAIKKATE